MRAIRWLVGVALLAAPGAQAIVFTVNSTLDLPDTNLGDGVCFNQNEMRCTLRAAVQEANALAGADTITLAATTYDIDTVNGTGEDAAVDGDLDVTSTILLQGAGVGATVVRAGGDGTPAERAFHVLAGGNLTAEDLTLTRKISVTPLPAGGVLNQGILTLRRCLVDQNRAANGGGVSNLGSLVVDACTFRSNHATTSGGGIFAGSLSGTTIQDSTFEQNSAVGEGGAIEASSAALLVISNSTLSGSQGSSALREQNVIQTALTHITLQASQGVGLSVASGGANFLDVLNTLVAGSGGSDCAFTGIVPTTRGSLASDASCGFALQNAAPLLGPLQNNGGPTDTHHPGVGSPAIDAASLSDCTLLDQRGVSRPQAASCDIGAVEVVPEPGAGVLGLAALGALVALRRGIQSSSGL